MQKTPNDLNRSRFDRGMRRGLTRCLVAALSLGLAGMCQAATQTPTKASSPYQGWAALADKDIDFAIQWAKDQSILAVYPDPAAFADTLAKARRRADDDLKHVDSFEGYRQAMKHFTDVFQDAHSTVNIRLMQTRFQWPGFVAIYRGHRFVTAGSKGQVADGSEISSCDGLPMTTWVSRIAPYEGVIPGLESTRARVAPMIFRDAQSPFLKRPVQCVIGGKTIELNWRFIAQADLAKNVAQLKPDLGTDVGITPFGKDGAWVRLGNFEPTHKTQSDQFEALFKAGPSLRNKSIIVFDVRGNGGGTYNWFMGMLRSIYGVDYADYYARARLQIAPVYRLSADDEDTEKSAGASNKVNASAPAPAPPDGLPYDEDGKLSAAAKARGDLVLRAPVNPHRVPMPSKPGVNPVHARVLVLTDYECGSACIGFVDEMKRFPGVIQIGTETFVDSRTGTLVSAELPSGNGSISVPSMTRDGRQRNDNEPQKPTLEFDGDIHDTPAVQAWIERVVLAPGGTP